MKEYSETYLESAYRHSSNHRGEVLQSTLCSCFYCKKSFKPDEIERWIDELESIGQTALCPKCDIDSVIGDKSGFPITKSEFIRQMHSRYF